MRSNPFVLQSLRLLRRELRHGIHGFGVFLSCLFLGVFAISAIANFTQAARSGLIRDAAALLGGDLEIRQIHRPLTPDQTDWIRTRATLSEVSELRTMAHVPSSGVRALVELKAIDSLYPLYGQAQTTPQDRLASVVLASSSAVAVEQDFLHRFSCSVGDQVTIGAATFQIAAVINQEPDRSLRTFNLGPRVMLSQKSLAATQLVQPGSLVTYAYRLKLPEQSQSDVFKNELEQQFPEAGWRVRSWREAAPRVRFFLDRMETNLTLLGLCSLLVGGVGVSGAVRGYLNSKRNHIATMKSLGATQHMVFTTYLLQITILGFGASLLALIAGASLPTILVKTVGDALPLPLDPGYFPSTWISSGLFGLLTALLFSLHALGQACQVTPATLFRSYGPNETNKTAANIWIWIGLSALGLILVIYLSSPDKRLATWFIIGASSCLLIFRLLAVGTLRLVQQLPTPKNAIFRLALANMKRPGSPAAGMIFSLGLGLTALVMVIQVQDNLNAMIADSLPDTAPAYFLFDIQSSQLDQVKQIASATSGVTNFDHSPTLRGRITRINGISVDQADISPSVRWAVRSDRFVSYSARKPSGSTLTDGAWWPDDYHGKPLISLTEDLGKGFGLTLGDNLTVNILGRPITAKIANMRSVDWSTLELNFAIIFAPGALEGAPQTHIAAVHLPPDSRDGFYRRITETFANISALSISDILANVTRTLTRIGWAFKAMAALTLLTGLLVLAGTISADQNRRIRDAVIYKVCGATRKKILMVFACEFVLLGLITAGMSLLVGSLAAAAILKGPLETTYRFDLSAASITLLCGSLLTLLLGLSGTWKALNHKAATLLRNE